MRYRAKIRQLENDLLFRLSNSQVLPSSSLMEGRSNAAACMQEACK